MAITLLDHCPGHCSAGGDRPLQWSWSGSQFICRRWGWMMLQRSGWARIFAFCFGKRLQVVDPPIFYLYRRMQTRTIILEICPVPVSVPDRRFQVETRSESMSWVPRHVGRIGDLVVFLWLFWLADWPVANRLSINSHLSAVYVYLLWLWLGFGIGIGFAPVCLFAPPDPPNSEWLRHSAAASVRISAADALVCLDPTKYVYVVHSSIRAVPCLTFAAADLVCYGYVRLHLGDRSIDCPSHEWASFSLGARLCFGPFPSEIYIWKLACCYSPPAIAPSDISHFWGRW